MKKIALSFVCLFTMINLIDAQWNWGKAIKGNGVVVSEKRDLGTFTSVSASSGIDAYIHQGEDCKVKIEAEENIIPVIITEVKNGRLKIYLEGSVNTRKPMVVNIWMSDIKGISASGGSDVYSVGILKGDEINLGASGGADIELELDVNHVDCTVSGGSDAELSGQAGSCKMQASGGSDIKAYQLMASTCTVSASGGSDAYVNVKDEINLSASGGSDVYYKGDAKIGKMQVSGSSDVHH